MMRKLRLGVARQASSVPPPQPTCRRMCIALTKYRMQFLVGICEGGRAQDAVAPAPVLRKQRG